MERMIAAVTVNGGGMEWVTYLVAALFFVLSGLCVVSMILSIPGAWIMLGLAFIIELCDGLYLPSEDAQTFPWWVLITCAGLVAASELIELAAGMAGAKAGGSSKRGMWGALIGGIAGALLMTFLLPIPIVGTLIGALAGTFIGAVVGETSGAQAKTMRGSVKPAIGATIGRVVGTVSKIGIAIAVWIALSAAAFWP
jgi:uncharacterized protein YqgC (DUF456 family)